MPTSAGSGQGGYVQIDLIGMQRAVEKMRRYGRTYERPLRKVFAEIAKRAAQRARHNVQREGLVKSGRLLRAIDSYGSLSKKRGFGATVIGRVRPRGSVEGAYWGRYQHFGTVHVSPKEYIAEAVEVTAEGVRDDIVGALNQGMKEAGLI